jgi:uncharacterized membrane protein YgcG
MPDRLLHRTWSVRTVSGPFVRALRVGGPRPRQPQQPEHPQRLEQQPEQLEPEPECQWYPTLSELAEDVTHRLRACPDLVQRGGGGGAGSSGGMPIVALAGGGGSGGGGGGGMLEIGGTYAALAWIHLDHPQSEEDDSTSIYNGGSSSGRSSSSRKRRHAASPGTSTGASTTGRRRQRHLHVDVRINDEPAGQILLCSAEEAAEEAKEKAVGPTTSTTFPSFRDCDDDPLDPDRPVTISSFSYLLLRGRMAALRPVLLYLESTLGCAVGTRPFQPSPADVARSLSDWMVGAVVRQRQQRQQRQQRRRLGESGGGGGSSSIGGIGANDDGNGTIGDAHAPSIPIANVNAKPLELTLAVPPHLISAGLERITLTVPPVALARLCAAVERDRHRHRTTTAAMAAAASPSTAPGGGGGAKGGGSGGSRTSSGGTRTPLMVTDSESASASASSGKEGGRPGEDPPRAKAPGDNDNDAKEKKKETEEEEEEEEEVDLPILRALQCYLCEAFRIDARHLPVVKAATAHAVVGTDGRIKPLAVEALPALLEDIGVMVRRATGG